MLRGVNIFCADSGTRFQALRRLLVFFLAPLSFLAVLALWEQYSPPDVATPASVQLWLEPLGTPAKALEKWPDDFHSAPWKTIQLPYTAQPWGTTRSSVGYRAWIRFPLTETQPAQQADGRQLGFMVNRVVASGPWSAWSDGRLLQTNSRDWGMQWNTPLRILVPRGAKDVTLSFPVEGDKGFALGSAYVGSADNIDQAWREREWWMAGISRTTTTMALLLAVMTLPLVLRYPKEPMYTLLCASAVVWAISNLQFLHDSTGNIGVSNWFGLALDVSINWNVALTLLFCYEFLPQRLSLAKRVLIAYAVLSSVGAVLAYVLGHYDLVVLHYLNFLVFCVAMANYIRYWLRTPTREATVLLLPQLFLLATAVHWMLFVGSMTQPDHIHTFPISVLGSVVAFLYAISRRWAAAIQTAQVHQEEMQRQLAQQKVQLQQQHEHIAALELTQQLQVQRQSLLQDLHDGLGSNLTTALVQARSGALAPGDTVLLLQELAQELRQLSAAPSHAGASVGDVLAQLRQRIEKRLERSAIELQWDVAPELPPLHQLPPGAGAQLRAILNEAVANAIKHAHASKLLIHARCQGHVLHIGVRDDGIGVANDTPAHNGQGLSGMHRRAHQMGWKLQTEPHLASNQGFSVTLQIPMRQECAPPMPCYASHSDPGAA